jgi:hypothetical protein
VIQHGTGCHPFVASDFPSEGEFLRAWYVSNGRDVALVTYVTMEAASLRLASEIRDASDIVASLDFQ